MSLLQNRIKGMGSDGAKKKAWKCPAGHLLQPCRASAGSCDGCKKKVASGDDVMECKSCNWYLCSRCHPQEKEDRSWFWRSVSGLADKVAQEFTDLQEYAEDAEKMGPLAACHAPPVSRDDEFHIGVEETTTPGNTAAAPQTPVGTAPPQTPVGTAPPAAQVAEEDNQATPPKTKAPKETIDLLALESDVPTSKAPQVLDPFNPMDVLGNKDPYDVLGGL